MLSEKKKFGENLRNLRLKIPLSQEELANRASLHRTYIGSVERGERNISLENIVQLARVLGVKPSSLLNWDFPYNILYPCSATPLDLFLIEFSFSFIGRHTKETSQVRYFKKIGIIKNFINSFRNT